MLVKVKRKMVSILFGLGLTACGASAPPQEDLGQPVFQDDFNQSGQLQGYTVNNPDALPVVEARNGRYYALVTNNENDLTLHFNDRQGRLDAQKIRFPFTVVVRNIGIQMLDSRNMPGYTDHPYIFAGVQVHSLNLDDRVSSHVVVGHRGDHYNTVEGKNTVNGHSWVTDVGVDRASEGRADLLIQGLPDKTLRVFWQAPNPRVGGLPDRWIAYNGTGILPGEAPPYGEEVYVGLITYAAGTKGLPFAGTADSFSLYQRDSSE